MHKHVYKLLLGFALLSVVIGEANSATLEPLNIKFKSANSFSSSSANTQKASKEPDLNALLDLGKNESLETLSKGTDTQGNRHVRYRQSYHGLPVWGQHVVVHDKSRKLYAINGSVARDLEQEENLVDVGDRPDVGISNIPGQPVEDKIKTKAEQWWLKSHPPGAGEWVIKHQKDSRQIFIHSDDKAYVVRVITYLVNTQDEMPARPTVIIDESSGKILKAWNALAHAEATGPGGNERVGRYNYGTDFPALDVEENAAGCIMENDAVRTIDHQSQEEQRITDPFMFECYRNTYKATNGAYSPINDAHYFSSVVAAMYQEWLSVDPLSHKIKAKVHYGEEMDNAFWDGEAVNFGDGNEIYFPFTVLDIVSHEISHGFTEAHSSLIYQDQSGAINESYSDIAGEAAEYYMHGKVDWLAGADLSKTGEPLRYFEDPAMDGASIGHAKDFFEELDVHLGSGVFNRAFYLLANSEGWNVQTGFQVFAHANQFYWTPTTTFQEGACGVMDAATDMGLPLSAIAVAFGKVGVVCSTDTTDSDADGMPDGWEVTLGFDYLNPADADDDADLDGLTNLGEYQNKADPFVADSDADSLSDGDEVTLYGTSPVLADTDLDGIGDAAEIGLGLDPLDAGDRDLDNDGDGVTNYEEFLMNTDPFDDSSVAKLFDQFHERFEGEIAEDWSLESSNPNRGWKVNGQWSSEGSEGFKADRVPDGERAVAQLRRLFEEGVLTLDYRVSSEEQFDFFQIIVDGNELISVSGEQSDSVRIELDRGVHTLQFIYVKDADTAANADAAWIDNLKFEGVSVDNDGDGISDLWELQYGFDPESADDAKLDRDNDGLTNLEEFQNSTDPDRADTDGDGLSDSDEVRIYGTSPLAGDTDADGIPDDFEIRYQLDPLDATDADQDNDRDGYSNRDEALWDTNPNDANSSPTPEVYFLESFEQPLADYWSLSASEGAANWQVNSQWASDGEQSLMMAGLEDSQFASVEMQRFVEAGTLSFDYRTSTEYQYDFLQVLIDGEEVLNVSGLEEGRFEVDLSSGPHRIQFVYVRDESLMENENKVWIDNLVFSSRTADSDADGMADGWETSWGLDSNDPADALLDGDEDGLTNLEEFLNSTNPQSADSDEDGLNDGDEVHVHLTSPVLSDTDADAIPDLFEVTNRLDPLDAADAMQDADSDGATNLDEYITSTDPNDALSVAVRVTSFLETFEESVPADWLILSTDPQHGWQRNQQWSAHSGFSLGVEDLTQSANALVEIRHLFSAGTLSFDYRVMSAETDEFVVRIDGEEVLVRAGEIQGRFTTDLEPGAHIIQILMQKNTSQDNEQGAWVDNVLFTGDDPDIDGDGMSTEWELRYNLDPDDPSDATLDGDNDGLTNLEEYAFKTDPTVADSDQDGLSDGDEVNIYETSPIRADTDADGMTDDFEIRYQLDALDAADADGDPDNDGFTNLQESQWGTDPQDEASLPVAEHYFVESFESGLPADWVLSGEGQHWSLNNEWYTDGILSLAISQLADAQMAAVEFTKLYEAGTLSFDYKTSTEQDYDVFRVYLDGEEVLAASGESEDSFTVNLDAGPHTIEFAYMKDLVDGVNEDTVWIDNVRFINYGEDHDNDGMSTEWEREHGLDPFYGLDALMDPDGDGFNNYQEFKQDSDPFEANVDVSVKIVKTIEANPLLIHYQLQVRNRGVLNAEGVVLDHRIPVDLIAMVDFSQEEDSQLGCELVETGIMCNTDQMKGKSKEVIDIRIITPDDETKHDLSASVSTQSLEHNSTNDSASKQYAGSFEWLSLLLLGWLGFRRKMR
ncbi:M4 family metallopeptidase [Ketobacter sp.]